MSFDLWVTGDTSGKLYAESYPSEWQDFLAENSSVLDTWVLEKFTSLVNEKKLPIESGTVLFLHLLGIDNTGHAQKPKSMY